MLQKRLFPLMVVRLLLFLLLTSPVSLKAQTIEVTAGSHDRVRTPLQVTLLHPLPVQASYYLTNTQTGKRTPAQLIDSITLAFILPDSLPAGTVATYTLRRGNTKTGNNKISIQKNKKGLLVKAGNKPLLEYHTAVAVPPAGYPDYYRRSGFIHPLYSPGGKILTDDFPAGHAHQHAIFMAWVNTTFKNDFVDFWNQHKQKGTIEHVKLAKIVQGPVLGQLEVWLRYKSFDHGDVLQEKWLLTFYAMTGHFLFDLESEQENISTDTLFLNKYIYGGLAFRGSRQWNPDDSIHFRKPWHILTSEGLRDSAANHTHARWVDAYGETAGSVAGATVFNHPSNFRYPQAIRVHPTMPYWCYAPVVDGAFVIAPGNKYRSKFRYYVHEGLPDLKRIENLEKDYVSPPAVSIRR